MEIEVATTRWTYDADGNVSSMTDAEDQVREYRAYTPEGMAGEEEDARGHVWRRQSRTCQSLLGAGEGVLSVHKVQLVIPAIFGLLVIALFTPVRAANSGEINLDQRCLATRILMVDVMDVQKSEIELDHFSPLHVVEFEVLETLYGPEYHGVISINNKKILRILNRSNSAFVRFKVGSRYIIFTSIETSGPRYLDVGGAWRVDKQTKKVSVRPHGTLQSIADFVRDSKRVMESCPKIKTDFRMR